MKLINKILLFIPVFLITSCISTIKIASVVEKNKDGDFLLKWEVSPDVEGKIDIYSAMSDTSMRNFSPIRTKLVEDQFALLNPTGSGLREFFLLKTSGVTSGIISNRLIEMDNILNFRDLGGYFTTDEKQLKWGKIYRSGHLSNSNLYDQDKLKRLGIKTIIDFRTDQDRKSYPYFINIQKINIPISSSDISTIKDELLKNNLTRSETISLMQKEYKELVDENAEKYAEMFDSLIDENNYPILITSYLGKDRAGIASALLLYVLGVPEYIIEEDYLASNKYIDPKKTINYSGTLPESLQESMTALFSANKAYLNSAFDYIRETHGSIDNYLEKKVRVSKGKVIILKKLLLYNP
ncbi:MAG: tyrosine-protein phosphatase [Dysgonamonadaceae bacterium]|nr:tyrosine-protein phosphatase [Dysgonamonadaceae bacterium]MDD4729652.1 tyrosine-protein phosphatase [Dysgonamonadaceae bacterium]